ncbi:MAG: hypothetical protein GXP05_14250 [Alphaproteobacteria bacterium]|nr:hypothetical protein [Alphaproteobacteria bacterium]
MNVNALALAGGISDRVRAHVDPTEYRARPVFGMRCVGKVGDLISH